jgi:hypothetical protein
MPSAAGWWPRQPSHSALGYLSPVRFEEVNTRKAA